VATGDHYRICKQIIGCYKKNILYSLTVNLSKFGIPLSSVDRGRLLTNKTSTFHTNQPIDGLEF
jgi:hypothetical protein